MFSSYFNEEHYSLSNDEAFSHYFENVIFLCDSANLHLSYSFAQYTSEAKFITGGRQCFFALKKQSHTYIFL